MSKLIVFLFISYSSLLLAQNGSFEFSGMSSNNRDVVNHGKDNYMIIDNNGIAIVHTTNSKLFKKGEIFNIEGIGLVKKTNNSLDLVFFGKMLLSENIENTIFFSNIRKIGDLSSGGGGSGEAMFVGGTGIYEGIKGKCDYDVKYLPDNKNSYNFVCNYEI